MAVPENPRGPATIKIAEDTLHPVRSAPTAYASGSAGGVYHTRSFSGISDRRSIGRGSQDGCHDAALDVEEGDDWRNADVKQKQVFRGRTLLW